MMGSTDWTRLQMEFLRYCTGDSSHVRRLFSALTQVLQGYFHNRLGRGDDVEDLVQITLLKIHFARDRYDAKRSLKTWVFTIASRSMIDHWRGEASHREVFVEPALSADDVGEELGILEKAPSQWLSPEQKTQLHSDLNGALQRLKPIDRSIVYLYGVEGLSMAEIAQALSLTESAVKLRAHRAYRELRSFLG